MRGTRPTTSSLRRIGREVTQGRAAPSWIPNAGSQMVIDVMNGIKRQYPFIDLLKPETEAAVPVLVALDPNQVAKLGGIVASVARLGTDRLRAAVGLLGVEESVTLAPAGAQNPEAAIESVLRRRLKIPGIEPQTGTVDELLSRTESRMLGNESPFGLIGSDQRQEYLGTFSAILSWIRGNPKSEVLRAALDGVKEDRSFDIAAQDGVFREIDQKVGRDIDFLVTGHTHQERALQRGAGRGFYFNTGTWAKLIQLSGGILDSPPAFAGVFRGLRGRNHGCAGCLSGTRPAAAHRGFDLA